MYEHTTTLTKAHLHIVRSSIEHYEALEGTVTRKNILTYLKSLQEDLNVFGNATVSENALQALKKKI